MLTLNFMNPGWLEGLIIFICVLILFLILTLISWCISRVVDWVQRINFCLLYYQNATSVRQIVRDEINKGSFRK